MRTEMAFEGGVEHLESRSMLSLADGVGVQTQFYPEGFANANVTEMVRLSNPGSSDVEYEVWARYETGQRDQLIKSGSLGGGEQGDVSISDPANPGGILVRPNEPYALVLRSFGSLSASLQHADWGSSAGESFTSGASQDWMFPTVTRDGATTRDYIVLFNTQDTAITAHLDFFQNSELVYSTQKQVDGFRRGGWNISKLPGLPRGVYSVHLHTTGPVIAALSHYDIVQHISSTSLATADGGAKAGAVLAAEWEDRQRPGDDSGHHDTKIAIFNPGSAATRVTLHFLYRDGTVPSHVMRIWDVNPHERVVVSLRDLNLGAHDLSIVYESQSNVSLAAFIERRSSFFVTGATTVAATQWVFPVAFADRVHASMLRTEDVLAFNPTDHSITVSFTFIFRNGREVVTSRTIAPFAVADVDVETPVQGLGAGHPFTVKILADGPVVASLEHWNRMGLLGAFFNHGVPGGTIVPLADALSPQF